MSVTMRAAVLYQREAPLEVEELELDEPQANEVLVRVVVSGVCRSDHHVIWPQAGPSALGGLGAATTGAARAGGAGLPQILGHEGAGIVEAVGPGVTVVQPGDHVILSLVAPCNQCMYCVTGHHNLCLNQRRPATPKAHKGEQRISAFGGLGTFGERTTVHEAAVVPIPKEFPLDKAALIGCGVTTGVGAVINTAKVAPGSNVVVIGTGGVGLSAVQGARLAGANRIIAVDPVPAKLEMAMGFGATHGINLNTEDVVSRVRELTGGLGADYAFECFGDARSMRLTWECVRRGGTAVFVGLPGAVEVSFPGSALVLQEKTIKGCFYGSARPRVDMPMLVELAMAGKLNLDTMITRRFALEEVNEAFAAMDRGEVARGVIMHRS